MGTTCNFEQIRKKVCKDVNKNRKKKPNYEQYPSEEEKTEEGNSKINTLKIKRLSKSFENISIYSDKSSISLREKKGHTNKSIISSKNIENLQNFMKNNELRVSFYEKEDLKDYVYNELKRYEKEILKREFDKISKNYKEEKLKNGNLKLNLNSDIITEIINNEDSETIYKKKIINEIQSIKNNDSSFKIDYLTILVVGRKKVGKTTLINYILKLPHNEDEKNTNQNQKYHKDSITYKNPKVPHLKFVEMKGIGLDDNTNPEKIGKDTINYINKHINNKNKNNYNDFVHCIWYCVSSTRFEKAEIAVLKRLKQAYKDNVMPIITVYTQTYNQDLADKMFKHINNQGVETIFIKVLAKDTELMDNSIQNSFGQEELLKSTLVKCTQSLKGKMISLMTQNISNEIKDKMLKINKDDEEEINKDIINNFIGNYKNVLKDDEFINYIIDILVKNLKSFYKEDIIKMSNASYNLIYHSDIIKNIKEFIFYYKKETKQIIKPIIEFCAMDFLDKQAYLEKDKKCNINIKNKRRFKGFKRVNEIHLKKYFYYISQKYIINFIIKNVCIDYFAKFREKFDSFIKQYLENHDEEIKYYLEDCFLTKLQKFAESKKIPVSINHPQLQKSQLDIPDKRQIIGEEELYKNDINSNSLDLSYNYIDSDNENDNKNQTFKKSDIKIDEWFPLKQKDWKYLNNDVNLLNNFLQKINIQDSFFCKNIKNDEAFQSLKEYIYNDLKDFFNSKKYEFIHIKIANKYNNNIIEYDKTPINKIIIGESIFSIYKDKIKSQFNCINNNNEELKIDYLTIILIGRSGAGKSTLINSMIMEDLAEEGEGDIVTKIICSYKNTKIPFLKFIDTRGIELNKEYGPSKILEDNYKYILKQKELVENDDNYNNYIQCLWYCLKDNIIEQKEIEIIKQLAKDLQSLPLIIVCPNSIDKQKVKKVEKEISDNLGNIPFIPVLGKDIKETIRNYGRDELLNKTLEICNNAVKGNIFNKIKSKINEQLITIFNDINQDIKININKKIVNKFTQEYNKLLNDDKLLEFIFDLLEINYVEYMKTNSNKEGKKNLSSENKKELCNSTKISNFIQEYIKYYNTVTEEVVTPILEDKELNYLDIQVKKEIKEFRYSINIENKNDRRGFRNIIKTFLNNNFYYISQKYIIYRIITDVCEPYSEKIEKEMNKIVNDILSNDNDAQKWFENTYSSKFEDFKEYINTFRNNGKIYENSNNDKNLNNSNFNNKSPNYNDNSFKNNYPEAPYPMF